MCLTIAGPLIFMTRVSDVHVSFTKAPKSCLSTTERSKAWPFPHDSFRLVIVSSLGRLCRIVLAFALVLIPIILALRLCFIRHNHRVEVRDLWKHIVSDSNNTARQPPMPSRDGAQSMGSKEPPSPARSNDSRSTIHQQRQPTTPTITSWLVAVWPDETTRATSQGRITF